jgi:hypothetical protein
MEKEQLKYYEDIALSNYDILNLLKGRVNIVLYPDLHKYKHIDDVLGKHNACILLFEAKPHYGHWCAIFKNKKKELEFFNSYGGYPDDSLNYIPLHFAEVSNQLVPYLSILMHNSPYELFYNEFAFQKHNKNTKTCGRHCVFRIMNKHVDIYEYKRILDNLCKKYKTDYDGVVTIMTT